MPEPWKLLKVPPMTLTSDRPKLLLDSLSVKLMVAVSPVVSPNLLLLTMMVGGVVSGLGPAAAPPMLRATALLGSWPSALKLPAASVKVVLETMTAPLLAPLVGVKVAV